MVTKLALLVIFAGACFGFPVEEEVRPPNEPAPVAPPQLLSEPPAGAGGPGALPGPEAPLPSGLPPAPPLQPGQEPPLLPGAPPAGGKPENADLKTDSSFWWRRTYYPAYYSRYYYRPRSYTTYSYYPSYYSYWNPYYWW